MEAKNVRGGCTGADHGGGHVPTLAGEATDRSVVFEHGGTGLDRVVLRHGHIPSDLVRGDVLCGAARSLAVSESVRGCGVF